MSAPAWGGKTVAYFSKKTLLLGFALIPGRQRSSAAQQSMNIKVMAQYTINVLKAALNTNLTSCQAKVMNRKQILTMWASRRRLITYSSSCDVQWAYTIIFFDTTEVSSGAI